MKCFEICQTDNKKCQEKECRLWVDFPEDLNCTLICINKHKKLNIQQIAERLHISMTRVSQITKEALGKLESKKGILRVLNE